MPKFVGNVVTKWLQEPTGEAREMKLVEDFAFQDPQGRIWKAPKGRKIDGASIPPVVWTLVGSPFTGNYRRASVIHDIACQDKPLTSAEAHRMFYDAMKADNTDEWTARVFYAAVSNFGPQWGDGARIAADQNQAAVSDFLALTRQQNFTSMPLEDIRNLKPAPLI